VIIQSVLVLLGSYISIYMLYWIVLIIGHWLPVRDGATGGTTRHRFGVLVPAHNEELLLPRLLRSIEAQDYLREFRECVVIADNCGDKTADVARVFGATVLERFDMERRGKGYALKYALEHLNIDKFDAIFVVDADCVVSRNALKSLDCSMRKWRVVQCYNAVENDDESWFTRLLDVSRTLNNEVFHPGKIRLGLSSHLMGTGMCFRTAVLHDYGWNAFSVGEDWEYYARLIECGEVIGFDHEARVYHQESTTLRQATTQRMRWSSGRFAIAGRYGFRLLVGGLKEGSLLKADASMPLLLPNPSLAMNISLLGLVAAYVSGKDHSLWFVSWFLSLIAGQMAIFFLGVTYTQNRFRKLIAIFVAPVFLAWKMAIDALSVVGVGRKKWVRTERKL
jgi:1,2-diacylglycerol 3-beta-glucosyltransferase